MQRAHGGFPWLDDAAALQVQIDEHHAVRGDAGMFDVSHMTIVDFHGSRIREFLRCCWPTMWRLTTQAKRSTPAC
ncbi:hypothetical protein MJ575_24520 [Klebsiella pneumoniae]|nr:hypothetical protein MJ575_24520 [Klebsiella pneumoniae]